MLCRVYIFLLLMMHNKARINSSRHTTFTTINLYFIITATVGVVFPPFLENALVLTCARIGKRVETGGSRLLQKWFDLWRIAVAAIVASAFSFSSPPSPSPPSPSHSPPLSPPRIVQPLFQETLKNLYGCLNRENKAVGVGVTALPSLHRWTLTLYNKTCKDYILPVLGW